MCFLPGRVCVLAIQSGQKSYPHVAQLINGCLASRLAPVRRCAYETLSNVALFAKEHRV